MNKHSIVGSTGLARIRALLAFRHQNPIARLISTVLAFAIAALLVVGSGAAYGDDTAPAPTDTSVATTPDPVTTDTTAAPADTTVDPATTSADTGASTTPSSTTPSGTSAITTDSTSTTTAPVGPMQKTLTTLAKPGVSPAVNGNAACQSLANLMVGGFEIDGDPCDDEGGIDFLGGPGDSVDDLFGSKSDDAFTGGSSESSDPATWALTGPQPTGKADIGTAWAWSHTYSPGDIDPVTPGVQLDPADGHVFAYFGFTNDSTAGGTQDYSLE
jgi:hypothetical protein